MVSYVKLGAMFVALSIFSAGAHAAPNAREVIVKSIAATRAKIEKRTLKLEHLQQKFDAFDSVAKALEAKHAASGKSGFDMKSIPVGNARNEIGLKISSLRVKLLRANEHLKELEQVSAAENSLHAAP